MNFWMVVKITPPDARSEPLPEVVAIGGLLGCLAQQVPAQAERAEQLVVEVVAVGQDDERRIGQRRTAHGEAGEERHQEALAGALRVPDDADLAVAIGAGGGNRLRQRLAAAVQLVIAGDDLERARSWSSEHREIPDQRQEDLAGEHAPDQRLELARAHAA